MKSANILLSLAGIAAASPLFSYQAGDQQVVLNGQSYDISEHPGFSLDLNDRRLVQLEGQEPMWVTELEKIQLKAGGLKFFDITDAQDLGSLAAMRAKSTPVYPALSHHEQVTKVIKTLSTEGPRANLEKFSSFRTRFYRSDTGKESQEWLVSKIREVAAEAASPSMQGIISIEEFQHSWGQHSIVARINGSSADDRIIILGAHQDSTNMVPYLPAPGADDDGSGTVTILEAYRALLASDFHPARPVEFHWYSGEEGGLLGSQAIARSYEIQELQVYAMSQYDMTAWVKKGTREEVGIIVDYVDDSLTNFNKQLVDAYLDIPYVDTKCGYACSDHAPWSKAGYPSIFTMESAFKNANSGNIHTARDRIDISDEFSFSHMLEFSKLAVAFAIELGGSEA